MPRDQARYYEIAKASAEEIRHHLLLCVRRGFVKIDPKIDRQVDAVCGMLFNLRQAVLRNVRDSR